jgi:hypothetical protein
MSNGSPETECSLPVRVLTVGERTGY